MKKKLIVLVILVMGIIPTVQATDQIFFDINGGVAFYPAVGGKIGWMHYWENEKVGLIVDASYLGIIASYPNADGGTETSYSNVAGISAGAVFNNMGMNGVIRTMQYVKLKLFSDFAEEPTFSPGFDLGFKLNVFFIERVALSSGIGIEAATKLFPHFYLSLGMIFVF